MASPRVGQARRVAPGAGALILAFALAGAVSPTAGAQERPFEFSLTTSPDVTSPQVRADYDVGVGEQTFRGEVSNAPEQRIGIQASIGRWTLIGTVGISMVQDAYNSSLDGEVLYSIAIARSSPMALAVGGGLLHEPSGTDVWLARVLTGHDAERWRIDGNLLLQMPHAVGRDAVDLITTVGWSRRITPAASLGIEGIGEDLEGFWNSEEAEGGARILVGPSLHIMPSARRWQWSVAGGPTFHPSGSALSSDALRELPAQTQGISYAVRASFACAF